MVSNPVTEPRCAGEPKTPSTCAASAFPSEPGSATASRQQVDAPEPQAAELHQSLSCLPALITPTQVLQCFKPHHTDYQSEQQAQDETEYIQHQLNPDNCVLFTSRQPPVSFADYVQRLMMYGGASPLCYLMAAGYCLRLEKFGLPLTPRSIHRIYLACLTLAIKTQDDFFMCQSFYAQCGGVPLRELNCMERQCFLLLGFDTGMSSGELMELLAGDDRLQLSQFVQEPPAPSTPKTVAQVDQPKTPPASFLAANENHPLKSDVHDDSTGFCL